MYCPLDILFPIFTLEMNIIQRSEGVFVSPILMFFIILLYVIRERFFKNP